MINIVELLDKLSEGGECELKLDGMEIKVGDYSLNLSGDVHVVFVGKKAEG